MKFIRKIIDYLTHGMWQKSDDEFSSRKELWLTKQLRVIIYTIKGVGEHGSVIRAAALTFYTLMSLVPILALAFGIIKGFGFAEDLTQLMILQYPQYAEIIESVFDFIDNILGRTNGGIVALSGLVFLIWAAIRVFTNVENAFNSIWEVKRNRSIGRKASAYAVVIFILPIMWIVISALVTYTQRVISRFSFLPNAIFLTLGALALIWLIFALAYKTIPYTKVKMKNALIGGGVAAIAFLAFQVIYVNIQSGVSGYNVIYGSFAAIPLFLLWIQVSWQIILMGAELSFSYQNIDSYLQERDTASVSYDSRRKITLAVLLLIIKDFALEKGGLTSEKIAHELRLPLRLIRDVIYNLEKAGLVIGANSDESEKIRIFLPAKDIHSITFYGALEAVETTGTRIESATDSKELKRVAKVLDRIREKVSDSEENMPLLELLAK